MWFDQLATAGPDGAADPLVPRPALDAPTEADVVVVGAGLTGLWTAYHLTEADPSLDVVVVDQEIAGYGASGRNGGWCSALFPVSAEAIARRHGAPAAASLRAAMRDTVVEVAATAAAEGVACDVAVGGTISLARSRPQLARAHAEARAARRWGDEVEVWDAHETRERLAATDVLGAMWSPDCVRVQPARLVRGLARVVEERGVRIHERTPVTHVAPHVVLAGGHAVRARHVVLATEAWGARLPVRGRVPVSGRGIAPVYSLMVATEPLPPDVWDGIGLRRGETFSDLRHLVVYGQRTADDRLAFGGRGAPYHWRSSVRPGHDRHDGVHAAIVRTLREMLPQVRDAAITHRWGGPLGVRRDWAPSVGLDPATGIAWAGGYVGDGVATTHLAGRTLADLLRGRRTALTRLPWVGHQGRRWEPEPWRWLGVRAGLAATVLADAEERATGRPSTVARLMAPLLGH
ncbi:FAD-dependent oxidoreductase [Actinotalea ferrariae]|nr:FAD-dependent oxidoreductase [Actinotalea ferrariae]